MYKMKPEYYTGVLFIDKEHARLFELVQETHELLNNDILMDKTDQLTDLISELINYTRTHFSHEEAYMDSIQYPHIAEHSVQHRQFESKLLEFDLDSIADDFDEQNEAVQHLLDFLVNWLINHIMKVDMLYTEKHPETHED